MVLVLFEFALWLVPGVIPGVLLEHFEKRIRGKIATGRYPTREQTVPFERDDGGFPFRIKKPLSEIPNSVSDHGLVSVVLMDELGFCNVPGSYDPQSIAIIALGDSFTWCTTVQPEDTVDFRYDLVFPDGSVPFNQRNADVDEVDFARRLQAGTLSLELLVEALEDYVGLSEEHGFVPVVAYTPAAYTTYQGFIRFAQSDLEELMPWFSQQQRGMLQHQAPRLGFVFVELTPALQEAAPAFDTRENLLYFPSNLHLTAQGHEIIARALQDELNALPGVLD